ncbi:MAG TPA: hypothetical protein VFN74_24595 [Chloroflexota bacterium]|nr:hypothetical protein [Chloroflexota bacterium]
MTAAGVTILTGGGATAVAAAERDGELWLRQGDVADAVGWEIRPEGVCAGEVCVPLQGELEQRLVERRDGQEWFNVSGFAQHVGQPFAREAGVWSFGAPRHEWEQWSGGSRNGSSRMAPDFALPDRHGKVWSLADFQKRKLFLVTWASW